MQWLPLHVYVSHSQQLVLAVTLLTIVLSSLRQRWCLYTVGCMGTVHGATVCSGAARCSGRWITKAGYKWLDLAIWMQWMHHGAQHARACMAALVAAAEALCAHGGCTVVQRMQWQCSGCLCLCMARTRSSSCSQWRRTTIALSSLRQRWSFYAVGCME